MWRLVTGRSPERGTATKLYGSVVAQAREPSLYLRSGVPDSAEGRLEMLMLHMALVLWRLAREGAAGSELARRLTEAYVTDMDDCMREMGIGDLSVPRKVKKAAAALYDRTRAYLEALDSAEEDALERALGTQILFPGAVPDTGWLARYMREARDRLARQRAVDLQAGEIHFTRPGCE
jgi:cytochrome b pre-mRNA-processing protein 3